MRLHLPATELAIGFRASSIGWFCIARFLFALVCLLVCPARLAFSQADHHAKDGDRPLLCGTGGAPGPRLLIGRFSLFGDFESSLGRSVEPAIVGTLAGNLLSRRDLPAAVSVWSQDAADTNRELSALIQDAFVGGASNDKIGSRRRADLQTALQRNNCDYLFGGRIAKDADIVVVTSYLFDVARPESLIPFPALSLDAKAIFGVGDRLSNDLALYLHKRAVQQPERRTVEIECLRVAAVPELARKEIEILAKALRRRLSQDLSTLKFSTPAISDGPSICATPQSDASPSAAASASGEFGFENETVELRPIVRIVNRDGAAEPSIFTFNLPSASRPMAAAVDLLNDYVRTVHEFLVAVTKDGAFPSLGGMETPETAEDLLRVWNSAARNGEFERGALAAYHMLSVHGDHAAVQYVLGAVLRRKKENELALEHFLRAGKDQSKLAPEVQAELNEAIGILHPNRGDALPYFRQARSLYEAQGKSSDARRCQRFVALTLFMTGEGPAAFQELELLNDLDSNVATLLLLGRMSALSSKYQEAEIWLGRVLKLQPDNLDARGLLADINEDLGRQELAARNFGGARRHLALSLQYRDDTGVRYLSGLAAHNADDYAAAISVYESIVNGPTEKTELRWIEGAWLNLLECYLLTKNYSAVETSGQRAISTIGGAVSARMIISYMRFASAVLGNPLASPEELRKNPSLKDLQDATATTGSEGRSSWDNTRIDKLIQGAGLDPEKKSLLDEAGQKAKIRLPT